MRHPAPLAASTAPRAKAFGTPPRARSRNLRWSRRTAYGLGALHREAGTEHRRRAWRPEDERRTPARGRPRGRRFGRRARAGPPSGFGGTPHAASRAAMRLRVQGWARFAERNAAEGRPRHEAAALRRLLRAEQPQHQFIPREPNLEANRHGCPQPEVQVVPGHRRIPAPRRRGAGNDAGVRVPLDHLDPRPERRFVQRIRELAQPSADGGDEATLLELPPARVAPRPVQRPICFQKERVSSAGTTTPSSPAPPHAGSAPCLAPTAARPPPRRTREESELRRVRIRSPRPGPAGAESHARSPAARRARSAALVANTAADRRVGTVLGPPPSVATRRTPTV